MRTSSSRTSCSYSPHEYCLRGPSRPSPRRLGSYRSGPSQLSSSSGCKLQALLGRRRLPTCSRHQLARSPCAAYRPYPFNQSEYYRAALQLVQAQEILGTTHGSLVMMRLGENGIEDWEKAMVLGVGGDTLRGIATLLQGQPSERPMSLDLLWQILERGQEISNRDWQLMRVAIVDMQHNVYLGRLFFGNPQSGDVWDCDCRPSDACWLALKAGCPIYIKKSVWEHNASLVKEVVAPESLETMEMQSPSRQRSKFADETSGTHVLTSIRASDPEPLKRLKREMAVSLGEEDYQTAARLRDHPFMQLHLKAVQARKDNMVQEAEALEKELQRVIEEQEQAPRREGSQQQS